MLKLLGSYQAWDSAAIDLKQAYYIGGATASAQLKYGLYICGNVAPSQLYVQGSLDGLTWQNLPAEARYLRVVNTMASEDCHYQMTVTAYEQIDPATLYAQLQINGRQLVIIGFVKDAGGGDMEGEKIHATITRAGTEIWQGDAVTLANSYFQFDIDTGNPNFPAGSDYVLTVTATGLTWQQPFTIDASGTIISGGIVSTPPPAPPGTIGVLPEPPTLTDCPFPQLSWNFVEVVSALAEWLGCTLRNLVAQLSWTISALGVVFSSMGQLVVYFISLQWLTDFLAQFFDRLDTWLSAKFGIDKDKPFLDELLKKFMTWLLSFLDTAAESEKKSR